MKFLDYATDNTDSNMAEVCFFKLEV